MTFRVPRSLIYHLPYYVETHIFFIYSQIILNSLLNLLLLPSWIYSLLHPKFIILECMHTSRFLQWQVYHLKPFLSYFPLLTCHNANTHPTNIQIYSHPHGKSLSNNTPNLFLLSYFSVWHSMRCSSAED